MTLPAFRASLSAAAPPVGLSLALQGLWHAAQEDWNQAHECAQNQEDAAGAWVHAYLHRLEGDEGNAAYWYRRAGKPVCNASFEDEWTAIAEALVEE